MFESATLCKNIFVIVNDIFEEEKISFNIRVCHAEIPKRRCCCWFVPYTAVRKFRCASWLLHTPFLGAQYSTREDWQLNGTWWKDWKSFSHIINSIRLFLCCSPFSLSHTLQNILCTFYTHQKRNSIPNAWCAREIHLISFILFIF